MAGVNKVILIGHLGHDPETKSTQGGDKICSFNLATTESYKNKDGDKVQNTEWHKVVTFRKLAEIAEKYLKKGSLLYVEGKLKTNSYTDKEGVLKYSTSIIADTFTMLSGSKNTESPAEENSSTQNPQSQGPESDDLPF